MKPSRIRHIKVENCSLQSDKQWGRSFVLEIFYDQELGGLGLLLEGLVSKFEQRGYPFAIEIGVFLFRIIGCVSADGLGDARSHCAEEQRKRSEPHGYDFGAEADRSVSIVVGIRAEASLH